MSARRVKLKPCPWCGGTDIKVKKGRGTMSEDQEYDRLHSLAIRLQAQVNAQEKRNQKLTRLAQEAYQIVAILAQVAGEFNSHPVVNALDKLSAAANNDEIPDTDLLPFMVEGKLESELSALRERVEKAIPTNWTDSLLTGKDGIGDPPWNCPDIEKLLLGLKERILKAPKP